LSSLIHRIHQAGDARSIAEGVIAELGYLPIVRGSAIVAHDAAGAPTRWLGDTGFDTGRVQAYLDGGFLHDPCIARVAATRAPAALHRIVREPARFAEAWGHVDRQAALWVLPLFGGEAVIGTLRVLVVDGDDPRWSDLVLVSTHISMRLAALGIESLIDHAQQRLSARQREIAFLVARGCTNAEIAGMLGCSSHAVKKQVSRVLALLEVSNRAELAALTGKWAATEATPAQPRCVQLVANRAA